MGFSSVVSRRIKHATYLFDALSVAVYYGFHFRSILIEDDEACRLAQLLIARLLDKGMTNLLEGSK